MLLIQSVVVGQMMIIWCWINGWMVGGERVHWERQWIQRIQLFNRDFGFLKLNGKGLFLEVSVRVKGVGWARMKGQRRIKDSFESI